MTTVNYHVHTNHSYDGDTPMEEMCRAALAAGLTDIAVTDHVEMNRYIEENFQAAATASFREAEALKAAYAGRLRIARGLELGQPTQDIAATESLLGALEFDFILGSLHNLRGGEDFYFLRFADMSDADIRVLLDQYFAELAELAAWGGFHALAHMDYPMRYIPAARRPDYTRWGDAIDGILRVLVENGLALEVNASGMDKPGGRAMPELPVVRRFRELGGDYVTLGADSHRPDAIARGLEKGAALLREAGFGYVTLYPDGRPQPRPL